MAEKEPWNMSVGLGVVGRDAVVYAAAQHGLSVRAWGAGVLEVGAKLTIFGDYLREIAGSSDRVSVAEAIQLVRYVEDFKREADPHPSRDPLPDGEMEKIATMICEPLERLVAFGMGSHRNAMAPAWKRAPVQEEVTIRLSNPVHKLVMNAASVSRRSKRELAQDLMEAAGAMGRVAGLKRQARLCRNNRVTPEEIVNTWIGMLVAAGCISSDADPGSRDLRALQGGLLDWYSRYSQRGIEVLEVNLRDREQQLGAPVL